MGSGSHAFIGRQQRESAFALIELLVIITVLLLVARLLLPGLFPQQWRAFDQSVMRGLGLPEGARFIIGVAFLLSVLAYGIVGACHYWHQRWLARRSSLQLPRDHGRFKA